MSIAHMHPNFARLDDVKELMLFAAVVHSQAATHSWLDCLARIELSVDAAAMADAVEMTAAASVVVAGSVDAGLTAVERTANMTEETAEVVAVLELPPVAARHRAQPHSSVAKPYYAQRKYRLAASGRLRRRRHLQHL